MQTARSTGGFTLIEMSIVLVIIGLIVGGVLVGQDLVRAAEVRAQVTQIEKYNSAVNTFRGKYGYVPGDMLNTAASQFGFAVGTTCNGTSARRDGDGLVEGWSTLPLVQAEGETVMFWEDITKTPTGSLIEGQFPAPGAAAPGCSGTAVTLSGSLIGQYFPAAKIGRGNYLYVYPYAGGNWYGLSAITSTSSIGGMHSTATIPAIQAYNIDTKMDDGMPTTGNVQAVYILGQGGAWGTAPSNAPNAASDNATSCYNTAAPAYSINYNGGTGANCALSFQFQ